MVVDINTLRLTGLVIQFILLLCSKKVEAALLQADKNLRQSQSLFQPKEKGNDHKYEDEQEHMPLRLSDFVRPNVASRVLKYNEIWDKLTHSKCSPGSDGSNYEQKNSKQIDIDKSQKHQCSQQIHITLGGENEIVVVYATHNDETESIVEYGTTPNDLSETVHGNGGRSYSGLLYFSERLENPALGSPYPGASLEEQLSRQNTSWWAHDGFFPPVPNDGNNNPERRFASYHNPKSQSWNDLQGGIGFWKNPGSIYTSPIIHTVTLKNLLPGKQYFYRVSGDDRLHSFQMVHNAQSRIRSNNNYYSKQKPLDASHLRSSNNKNNDSDVDNSVNYNNYSSTNSYNRNSNNSHLVLGIAGDLGQTSVSNHSLTALQNMNPDLILISGDLSYAEGWHPRWDAFGNLAERLFSQIPMLSVGGNHEVMNGESWMPYNVRYPNPALQSGSRDNTYWSKNVENVHIIGLNSYAETDADSLQYKWLVKDLANINRSITPWIIVMMHVPFYTTISSRIGEGKLMQRNMEDLFYKSGVDIVLNGHVHSYERTTGVYRNEYNLCGPVHLNLGDGGNYEGVVSDWVDISKSNHDHSKKHHNNYDWSAFRESAFGVAQLDLINDRVAKVTWKRHACMINDAKKYHIAYELSCESPDDFTVDAMVHSDEFEIVRLDSQVCPNKYISESNVMNDDFEDRNSNSGSNDEYDGVIVSWYPIHILEKLSLAVGIVLCTLLSGFLSIRMKLLRLSTDHHYIEI